MKKALLTIAAVATLGLAGYQMVDAQPYGPGYGMMAPGYGMMGTGYGGQVPDEATLKAQEKFYQDTTELRKKMVTTRTELHALMSADNPDSQKAAKLSGELFELREQMHAKATEAGITKGFGGVFCDGPGAGHGMKRCDPRHRGM